MVDDHAWWLVSRSAGVARCSHDARAHGAALLGDRFLHPSVGDLLVPGLIDYRPVAVATGIVGGYLVVLVGVTFYMRERIRGDRWRALHRFSALAWVLSVVHTPAAGSDAGAAWLRYPLSGSIGVVVALLSARLPGRRFGSRRSSRRRSWESARSPAR